MHPEENPWKIISQKNVYDNSWINLTEYQVINPAGNPGIYGKVHFKGLAIGIIPLDSEMNIYIVGQYRFAPDCYSWEIPEGGGALNIDPLESAKRELLEETGLKAKRWSELQRTHLSNSVTDELCIIYLAQELEQFEPEPEETEQLVIKKIPFEEVYEMVLDGEITDSVTVIAIMKLKLMIIEGIV
ncbi:MAG: NUDIX hydrolase [Bacteroidetes bacterium]|nr:NUDIX hydrolase [Bacteroidota bacterium]